MAGLGEGVRGTVEGEAITGRILKEKRMENNSSPVRPQHHFPVQSCWIIRREKTELRRGQPGTALAPSKEQGISLRGAGVREGPEQRQARSSSSSRSCLRTQAWEGEVAKLAGPLGGCQDDPHRERRGQRSAAEYLEEMGIWTHRLRFLCW